MQFLFNQFWYDGCLKNARKNNVQLTAVWLTLHWLVYFCNNKFRSCNKCVLWPMKYTKLQRFSKVHVLKITGNLSSYVVTYRYVYCVYLNIRWEMILIHYLERRRLPCHHAQFKCILWRYVPENWIFLRELYYVGVNVVHVYCVGCYEVNFLVAWHVCSVCVDI